MLVYVDTSLGTVQTSGVLRFMGDDKWTHREPGSISGSFVPPPVEPEEPPAKRSPPLPRRKSPTRSAGSEPLQPESPRRVSGSANSVPPAAESSRRVTGSGPRKLRLTQPPSAPPQLPDNVRYLFRPVLAQSAPDTGTESADADQRTSADQQRGSGRSALARGPRATAPPVIEPPAAEQPGAAQAVSVAPVSVAPATARPEAGSHRRHAVGQAEGQLAAGGQRSWLRSRVRRHGIRVAVLLLAMVAAGSTALALTRHGPTVSHGGHAGAGRRPPSSGGAFGPYAGPNATGGLSAAGIMRAQAARWVSTDVSKNAIIACDGVMCSELINEGVSASNLLVLGPTAPDPLGADIVMATAALRSQFGGRLTTEWAPSVIASFGSGRTRVDVRVVAPYGAAAYERALARDLAARQRDGNLLLRNTKIAVSVSARPELIAGLVDPRLLVMLPVLAHQHPIRIIGFYDRAPGSSLGVPLTGAELAGTAAGLSRSRYLRWLLMFLHGQRPPFRPVSVTTAGAHGHEVVRVQFARPSPIGLLNGAVSGSYAY